MECERLSASGFEPLMINYSVVMLEKLLSLWKRSVSAECLLKFAEEAESELLKLKPAEQWLKEAKIY